MPLRPGVGIVNQIGLESTAGVAVPANKFLPTVSFKLDPKVGPKPFRAQGSRVRTSTVQQKRMSPGSFEGILDYNSFAYILEGLFNSATPVARVPSLAFERVYTAGTRTADSTRKTFTVEQGDATAVDQFAFAQLLSLTLEAGQEDFNIGGNVAARYPTFNASQTASPTEIAERPVERDDIDLFIDTSFANLGTTQVTEALAESLSINDKFKPVFVHNRTAGEFYDVVELPYEAMFGFETAHNAQSRAIAASLSANAQRWIRWEAVGALLGNDGSNDWFETIRIDMAGKFDDPEVMRNDEDPYAFKFNFGMQPDIPGLGTHLKITIINGLATL